MSKDLAAVKDNFKVPALNADMSAAMSEEMDGLTTDFDRVKIPTGGSVAFEVPGDDSDNPDMAKEIIGIIVDHHPINAYWEQKFEGQNNAPDCSSIDGKCGVGTPGGPCSRCPMGQWGSAVNSDGTQGKGKACKNMHRIYILRSGEMLPLLLTLPPTSLKPFSNYMAKRIICKGHRPYEVITKVTLKKAVNGSGITYSQAQFAVEAVLDKDTAAQMKTYSESIKRTTRQLGINDDDYDTENHTNSNENIPF